MFLRPKEVKEFPRVLYLSARNVLLPKFYEIDLQVTIFTKKAFDDNSVTTSFNAEQ